MKTLLRKVIMEVELDGEEYLSPNRDSIIRQKISETNNTSRTISSGRRRHRHWTTSELNYLNENYGKLNVSTMARYLKRSDSAVASQLYVQRNPTNTKTRKVTRTSKSVRRARTLVRWTPTEIRFLKNNIAKMSYTELAKCKELKGRSSMTIGWKTRELKLN